MEGFGIEKLGFILVIVLVLFGARRVPEIGASFGRGIREFKRGLKDVASTDSESPPAVKTVEQDAPDPKRLLTK